MHRRRHVHRNGSAGGERRERRGLLERFAGALPFALFWGAGARAQDVAITPETIAQMGPDLVAQVDSMSVLDDGRPEVNLSNGQTVHLAPAEYAVTPAGVVISEQSLQILTAALASSGVSAWALAAGGAALAGAGAAAFLGGGGSEGEECAASSGTCIRRRRHGVRAGGFHHCRKRQ